MEPSPPGWHCSLGSRMLGGRGAEHDFLRSLLPSVPWGSLNPRALAERSRFQRSGFGVLPGLNVQSRLFPEVLAAWARTPHELTPRAAGGGGAAEPLDSYSPRGAGRLPGSLGELFLR